jgi:hypothetical protein
MPSSATSIPDYAIEAAELELSIDREELDGEGCEAELRRAVEGVGAVLLFHVKVVSEGDAECHAALAFDPDEENRIAILTLAGDGSARIAPVDESDSPIATIAPAFAGLAETWAQAA